MNKKALLYLLAVCLPLASQVYAYNGRATEKVDAVRFHDIDDMERPNNEDAIGHMGIVACD